jgi:RNA polymerase sigma factor (sigma-70 family)
MTLVIIEGARHGAHLFYCPGAFHRDLAMTTAFTSFIRRLSGRVGATPSGGLSDAQLLDRWLTLRDEAAFEVLLWRHGPMILGVCRRVLGNHADVEDAFQAAFLLLVRKAGTIRQGVSVGAWLYRVAYRVALRARERSACRAAQQDAGVEQIVDGSTDNLTTRELRAVLDDEIHRLPAKYRTPLVRCYLEGCSNEEIAVELNCPVGTIYSRLAWARERLRSRLERRGITSPSAALPAWLAGGALAEIIPAKLAEDTIRAALAFAAHSATAAGVSAGAVALAKGVSRTMFVAKMRLGAAVVLALVVFGGAGGMAFYAAARPPAGSSKSTISAVGAEGALAEAAQPWPVTRTIRVPSQVDGLLVGIFTEIAPKDKAAPKDVIVVGKQKYRRLREGDQVKAGQLLARIDDALALDDVTIAEARLAGVEADLNTSAAMREEAKRRLALLDSLRNKADTRAVTEEDYSIARVTVTRYSQEESAKKANVIEAQWKLRRARTQLKMHEIRSPADGVIKTILFRKGEAVKRLETVLEIAPSEEDR